MNRGTEFVKLRSYSELALVINESFGTAAAIDKLKVVLVVDVGGSCRSD